MSDVRAQQSTVFEHIPKVKVDSHLFSSTENIKCFLREICQATAVFGVTMCGKFAIAMVVGFGMVATLRSGQFELAEELKKGINATKDGMLVHALAREKSVQCELKMTKEQITKVNEWYKEFLPKTIKILKENGVDFEQMFTNGLSKDFSREKLIEKINAGAKAINKVAYKDLGEILHKDQIERLEQIDRQNMGLHAFTNSEVVTAMKLSEKQKTSITEIIDECDEGVERILTISINPGMKIDEKTWREQREEAMKKMNKLREGSFTKIVDLLDKDQKNTWRTLIGEPFDLSKISFSP